MISALPYAQRGEALRYRLANSGTHWGVVGRDRVLDDLRPRYPDYFAGYAWHKGTCPDSAATMTHMVAGVKTYNGAINVGPDGKKLFTVAELAKAQ